MRHANPVDCIDRPFIAIANRRAVLVVQTALRVSMQFRRTFRQNDGTLKRPPPTGRTTYIAEAARALASIDTEFAERV
jgi:hypothetical protein